MSAQPPHSNPSHEHPAGDVVDRLTSEPDDTIDFREILFRIGRGKTQILGLGFIGFAIGAIIFLAGSPFFPVVTSTRLSFSFPGFERGEYPDHSKFQVDDIRSPVIVGEALKRQGIPADENSQSEVRGALSIEGIISPEIIKERDKLRASGQVPPPYIPDEYILTLTLPRKFPISGRQRELLLNEIISVYREKFQQTYAELPAAFGNAFNVLSSADFFEFELVLNEELHNITDFLDKLLNGVNDQPVDPVDKAVQKARLDGARYFRSRSTNLSFSDLHQQTELFMRIRLNETLGLIHASGLSRDRKLITTKLNYHLHNLEDRERQALEEQKVVQELLANSQERTQNYVLGIKSQATQPDRPLLDQGLIDSLLANDAYNMLVRKALEAGLKTKDIQAEKSALLERIKILQNPASDDDAERAALVTRVQSSLTTLQSSYNELIAAIRKTYADFARQQFADALRVTREVRTEKTIVALAKAGGIGLLVGAIGGLGLSLIEIYVDGRWLRRASQA
jgi:hypothetical protein